MVSLRCICMRMALACITTCLCRADVRQSDQITVIARPVPTPEQRRLSPGAFCERLISFFYRVRAYRYGTPTSLERSAQAERKNKTVEYSCLKSIDEQQSCRPSRVAPETREHRPSSPPHGGQNRAISTHTACGSA
jgi:hypothetical protein